MHSSAIVSARMMRPFPALSRETTPETSPARKCGVSSQSEPESPSGDDTCAHTFTRTAFLAMIKIGYPDSTQLAPSPQRNFASKGTACGTVRFLYPTLTVCYNRQHRSDHKARFLTHPTAIAAYEDQDLRFARPFGILEDAVAAHAFPSASIAITHDHQLLALRTFARFTYDPT